MARLDRLGPAKEMAQIGAAIGREFSHPLLAAVVRKSDDQLGSALDRLIAAGLLFRQGVPPHSTYLFKHVLSAGCGLRHVAAAGAADARCMPASAETLEGRFAEIAEKPAGAAWHVTAPKPALDL